MPGFELQAKWRLVTELLGLGPLPVPGLVLPALAHALAKTIGKPLLFKGDDFAAWADIEAAC